MVHYVKENGLYLCRLYVDGEYKAQMIFKCKEDLIEWAKGKKVKRKWFGFTKPFFGYSCIRKEIV